MWPNLPGTPLCICIQQAFEILEMGTSWLRGKCDGLNQESSLGHQTNQYNLRRSNQGKPALKCFRVKFWQCEVGLALKSWQCQLRTMTFVSFSYFTVTLRADCSPGKMFTVMLPYYGLWLGRKFNVCVYDEQQSALHVILPIAVIAQVLIVTRIKNIKNVTRCRDSPLSIGHRCWWTKYSQQHDKLFHNMDQWQCCNHLLHYWQSHRYNICPEPWPWSSRLFQAEDHSTWHGNSCHGGIRLPECYNPGKWRPVLFHYSFCLINLLYTPSLDQEFISIVVIKLHLPSCRM